MYLPVSYKIQYDTTLFPFKELISKLLDVKHLEKIHLLEHYDLFKRENDQKTIWHERFYAGFENEGFELYTKFLQHLKERFEYESLVFQKIPTFRVQLGNGNLGVGEWHKDKTYNHGSTEVNFWMPFTDTNNKNCVWIETKEDKGDYLPHNVKYGEILVFDGANLHHGNQINDSGQSRVSMDFRLVDPDKFKGSERKTLNSNMSFDIGGYFEKI